MIHGPFKVEVSFLENIREAGNAGLPCPYLLLLLSKKALGGRCNVFVFLWLMQRSSVICISR